MQAHKDEGSRADTAKLGKKKKGRGAVTKTTSRWLFAGLEKTPVTTELAAF